MTVALEQKLDRQKTPRNRRRGKSPRWQRKLLAGTPLTLGEWIQCARAEGVEDLELVRFFAGIPRWLGIKAADIGRANEAMTSAQVAAATLLDRAGAMDLVAYPVALRGAVHGAIRELAGRRGLAEHRIDRALRLLEPALARSACRLKNLTWRIMDPRASQGRVTHEAAVRAVERLAAGALAELLGLPGEMQRLRRVVRLYLHFADLRASYCRSDDQSLLDRAAELEIQAVTLLDFVASTAQTARQVEARRLCLAAALDPAHDAAIGDDRATSEADVSSAGAACVANSAVTTISAEDSTAAASDRWSSAGGRPRFRAAPLRLAGSISRRIRRRSAQRQRGRQRSFTWKGESREKSHGQMV